MVPMNICVLSGGPVGAAFVRGLVEHVAGSADLADSIVTVIVNTGDDISLWGLRLCPDLDRHVAALSPAPSGAASGDVVRRELDDLGAEPDWYPITDAEVGASLARTSWLARGDGLAEVTERLARRRGVPEWVRVLPMSDVPVETHAVLEDEEGQHAVHVQEWRRGPEQAPSRFVVAGLDRATPAPGVLEALRGADVVLLAPSDPVLSLGIVLGVPGVRDAVRGTTAPVVGTSPGGLPSLTASLAALGEATDGAGARNVYEGLLDGWLADPQDPAPTRSTPPTTTAEEPITLASPEAAARTAGRALELGRATTTA